jgi:transposase
VTASSRRAAALTANLDHMEQPDASAHSLARVAVASSATANCCEPLKRHAALLAIPGIGPITAARLLGETGDPAHFRSAAAFAVACGVASIPA